MCVCVGGSLKRERGQVVVIERDREGDGGKLMANVDTTPKCLTFPCTEFLDGLGIFQFSGRVNMATDYSDETGRPQFTIGMSQV